MLFLLLILFVKISIFSDLPTGLGTQVKWFENETAQKSLPELTLQVQGPKFHGSVIMYITDGIMFKKHSTIKTIPTFINRPLNGYLK